MEAIFPFPKVKTKIRFLKSREQFFSSRSGSVFLLDKNLFNFVPEIIQKNAFQLPAGEACKRWQCLSEVLAWLSEKNVERSATLVVIGGGAACDLGALAAALYRRGMALVLVPTTLLAQIDASIGGKCAVDFLGPKRMLKNFAGVFYPAKEVFISFSWLASLPERERRSGLGEMLKMLYLEGEDPNLSAMQGFLGNGSSSSALKRQITIAIAAKTKIVKRDPLDQKRIRERLNFGHTVGHALESLAKGKLSHGEAIAFGMFFELAFCEKKSHPKFSQNIYADLRELGFSLPSSMGFPSKAEWEALFRGDKKMQEKELSFSIAVRPGVIQKRRASPRELAKFMAEAFPAIVQLGKVHLQE